MKIPVLVTPVVSGVGARRGEPVTFGVPLPRGLVNTLDNWTVDTSGRPAAVQARALNRWSDGSIRWALVDAQIDSAGPGAVTTFLGLNDASVTVPAPPVSLRIDRTAGDFTVDTGTATFMMGAGGSFPFDRVVVNGEDVIDGNESGLRIADREGLVDRVRITTIAVEESGPLRATVRLGAVSRQATGGRTLEIDARIDFYAGLPVVRMRCTILNPDAAKHPGNYWDLGDPGSVFLKDASLVLTAAGGPSQSRAIVSAETGASYDVLGLPLELYQDSSGGEHWKSSNHMNRDHAVPTTFRGYRLRTPERQASGLRATPVLILEHGSHRLGAAVPSFWQNFPRAVEATTSTLTVRLFPGQFSDLYEMQGGEQKTHDSFLSFGVDPVSELPLDWCRYRSVVSVSPDWLLTSGAVDFLAPLDEAHDWLVRSAIEGADTFERKREVIDEYGWRHFGEIYGDHETVGHPGPEPLVSHYNNQYDPVAGFALQFMRTADVRWWQPMAELASHVVDIDIYHTQKDKTAYNGGLFWHTYHYGDVDTATHRTYPLKGKGRIFGGGPSADHNYPTGLGLHYFLTGDQASFEAAVGLAQYVLNLDDGRLSPFRFLSVADTGRANLTSPDFYGPARSSGNSLNALVDGHRLTGDPKFLTKAEQLVRRVVHPAEDIRRNGLDDLEYRWYYLMFLQALGKYLHHRAELGLVDEEFAYGRGALLHYARWMSEHEYPYLDKPEKLEYPTETWAAQDIRKSDVFYLAAMHADGDERGRFIERAEFFHRTSVTSLASMPTRTFARPVIVLLTAGQVHSWFQRHRDAAEPKPSGIYDFGTPQVFVPQRKIAERRAKLIAVAAALIGLSAIAGLAAWIS